MKVAIKPNKIELKFHATKVYPELEDLEITPSSFEQNFKSSKYGYDNVKVKAIETTELNIMPSTENQTKEGLYNKVTVAGDSNLIPENIKENVTIFNVTGTAEVKGEENAIIDSSKLIKNTVSSSVSYVLNRMITKLPKNINTSEWTTMSYMFYNCINLKNLDLSNFDTSNVINMNAMFSECNNLVSLDLSNFDTSKVTDMSYMFSKCSMLTSLDVSNFNISKAININNMFENCKSLVSLDLSSFDLSSYSNNLNNLFFGCSKLENLKSFKNLGKGYTKKSNNYYSLGLNYSNLLTHESLMDVINNLYDLNLTYNVANGGTLYRQTLNLGTTNKAKLTAEEIAIATAKRLDCIVKEEKKMLYFSYTKPKMIVAENGKQIRQVDDIYKEAYIDENGQEVPEHLPYYSTTIFVPDSFTEEQMNELYIEENIEK